VNDTNQASTRRVPRLLVWALGALVIVLVAAAVTVASTRLSHRRGGAAAFSAADNAAISAARQETINIQTYRRASFDADFAAAMAGLTPAKRTQWQANEATLKSKLTSQKIDATASVSAAGLVSSGPGVAVVALACDTYRVDANGKSTLTAQNRLQVTMKRMSGKWLMDDLSAVSVG